MHVHTAPNRHARQSAFPDTTSGSGWARRGPSNFPEGQCQMGWGTQRRPHPGGGLGTGLRKRKDWCTQQLLQAEYKAKAKAGR